MRYLFLAVVICAASIGFGQTKAVLDLSNNEEYSSFSIFDSLDIQNYNLFFTGEDHRYPLSNSDLELKMFKYLHQKAGVRVFIVEFGQGMGYLMNSYIANGDSVAGAILERHSYKAYFDMFRKLKEFNDDQAPEDKFTVQSVDVERELVFSALALEYMLPKDIENAHDSIKIHLEALKSLAEFFDKGAENYYENGGYEYFDDFDKEYLNPQATMELVASNYATHKEKYQTFLGESFFVFDRAMGWLNEHIYWQNLMGTPQQYLYRENYMASNVERMYTLNPQLKAYGQFGRCHTQLSREKEDCNYYYFNALATRLNKGKHPQLAGKVFSCPIFYPNGNQYFTTDYSISSDIVFAVEELTAKAAKNSTTAFDLDTVQYPYLKPLRNRYDAILINTNSKDKSEDYPNGYTPDFRATTRDVAYSVRVLVLAEGGVKGYDFKALNKALGTKFNNQPQYFGLTLGFNENYGGTVKNSFYWFPETENKINDSTTAKLSGYGVAFQYGKDVLKSEKYDLSLGAGFGYERWRNVIDEKFTDAGRKDVFGSNRTTKYTNPAFLLATGIDFQVHIARLSLGFFGRYQFDVSNQKWRLNNSIQPNSPKFSLSAYNVGVSLGLNF